MHVKFFGVFITFTLFMQKTVTVRSSVLEVLLEIIKFCDVYLMEQVLDDESEVCIKFPVADLICLDPCHDALVIFFSLCLFSCNTLLACIFLFGTLFDLFRINFNICAKPMANLKAK